MGETSKIGSSTSRIQATVALALAGSLWGTAFLFGKIAFREMSVSTNVALRFCFGSLVLLPLLFRRTRRSSEEKPLALYVHKTIVQT